MPVGPIVFCGSTLENSHRTLTDAFDGRLGAGRLRPLGTTDIEGTYRATNRRQYYMVQGIRRIIILPIIILPTLS